MSTLYNAQGLRIRDEGGITKVAPLILPPQYRKTEPVAEKKPLELRPQRWAIVGTKLIHEDDLSGADLEKAVSGGRATSAGAGWWRMPLPQHQWLDGVIGAFYRVHGLVQIETRSGKTFPHNIPLVERTWHHMRSRPVTYTEVWLHELFGPLAWR